jgi:hypothetical protein
MKRLLSRGKFVPGASLTGQQGINLIATIVGAMGYGHEHRKHRLQRNGSRQPVRRYRANGSRPNESTGATKNGADGTWQAIQFCGVNDVGLSSLDFMRFK